MKRLIFILFLWLLLAVPAIAQEPTADEVNSIAKHLNCPTCDTRSLDDCNTLTCLQWKEQIRDMMIEGRTQDEILDWYVARYGDYVLQAPPGRGLGLLAWSLPIIGFVVAGIWLGFLMKKWTAKATKNAEAELSAKTKAASDSVEQYLTRVEQDLQNQT